MDFFTGIINFFTDRSWSISVKAAIVLVILALVLIIDHMTGYSYFLWRGSQLNQIERIEALKSKNKNDPYLLLHLDIMEEEVLSKNRNILKDYFSFYSAPRLLSLEAKRDSILSAFAFKSDTSSLIATAPDSIINKRNKSQDFTIRPKTNISSQRGSSSIGLDYLHIITSSYSFLLLILVIPFVPLSKKELNFNMILGALTVVVINIFFVWLFSFLFGFLPDLGADWKNYLVNFSLHTCFLLSMVFFARAADKKKQNEI